MLGLLGYVCFLDFVLRVANPLYCRKGKGEEKGQLFWCGLGGNCPFCTPLPTPMLTCMDCAKLESSYDEGRWKEGREGLPVFSPKSPHFRAGTISPSVLRPSERVNQLLGGVLTWNGTDGDSAGTSRPCSLGAISPPIAPFGTPSYT